MATKSLDHVGSDVHRLLRLARCQLRRLRDRHEPTVSADAMFTAQNLRPVDAATAEERFAHLPLEDDR